MAFDQGLAWGVWKSRIRLSVTTDVGRSLELTGSMALKTRGRSACALQALPQP